MKQLSESEAQNKAATYCTSTEHCRSEVDEKLRIWGIDDATVRQRIIASLTKERYIDESRYCRSYINDKIRFNKWGRKKIALLLAQKGIASQVIEYTLNEVDEEEYLAILQDVITSKLRTTKGMDSYDISCKIIRFAIGRGFEFDLIKQTVESLLNTSSEG